MRSFVLRARAAPTTSKALLEGVGNEAHTEILAHTMMNTMFVAQSHREDVGKGNKQEEEKREKKEQ